MVSLYELNYRKTNSDEQYLPSAAIDITLKPLGMPLNFVPRLCACRLGTYQMPVAKVAHLHHFRCHLGLSGLWLTYNFLPLDEAIAYTAVFVIVLSDGRFWIQLNNSKTVRDRPYAMSIGR